MSDGKFGGSGLGRASGDSSYGFFAGNGSAPGSAPSSAPSSGPSSFGGASTFGAPAPAAPPAFGTPTYGPGGLNPYGAPGAPAYVGAAPGRTKRSIVALVVVALVVVVGGFGGYRYYQHHRAITLPATLDGLTRSTDPKVTASLDTSKKSVQAQNPDFALDAAVYGTGKNVAFLLIGRGDVNMANELAATGGATKQVGSSTCLVQANKTLVACIRTGGQLTVMVLTANLKGDFDRAAGMVDEAWNQQ